MSYWWLENDGHQITWNPEQSSSNFVWYTKSAREQVQEAILLKISEALANDNIAKVKELLQLAQQIKEL